MNSVAEILAVCIAQLGGMSAIGAIISEELVTKHALSHALMSTDILSLATGHFYAYIDVNHWKTSGRCPIRAIKSFSLGMVFVLSNTILSEQAG